MYIGNIYNIHVYIHTYIHIHTYTYIYYIQCAYSIDQHNAKEIRIMSVS